MPQGNWVSVVNELTDVLAHVIECIRVVAVRLRRCWDGERDVVATIVIALVARLLVVSLRTARARLVHWFKNRSVPARQEHLLIEGLGRFYFLLHARLSAVFADIKEVLNFFTDQGELALLARLPEASKVIVTEDLDLLIFLALGEHGVDQEDR